MTTAVRVRAPATTANLGPGFDCAAAALDLWNELELSRGAGDVGSGHLGVQAFARLVDPDGWSFRWIDRIPRERGLGSSAAVIALGLVAGAAVRGEEAEAERLLAAGLELEGHPDNLAAALAGGVCLTWEGRIARVSDDAPAVPIALVPEETVSTAGSRAGLPGAVPHADAAFTTARAALLGAALVAGSEELFADVLDDRLHEPYRAADAPLLASARPDLPAGALGATLSGSGPTMIVWARRSAAVRVRADLAARFPRAQALRLAVTPKGAEALETSP